MTMRISDRYERFTDRVSASKADKAGGAKGSDPSAAKPGPAVAIAGGGASVLSVHVSDRAAQLSAGSARLEELKARIRDGSFAIDSRAIARSIAGEDDHS